MRSVEEAKMAELESSLTAMDWLPRLTVGGALAGGKNGAGGLGSGKLGSAGGTNGNSTGDGCGGDSNGDGPQKDGKPPYSYANLITFAINSNAKKKMTLSEIYAWICENFPYYKDAGNGWKVGTNLTFH